jgi:hypothetical protein
MRTLSAGPSGVFRPGDIREGKASELQPLVDGGYADLLDDAPLKDVEPEVTEPEPEVPEPDAELETASFLPPETTQARRTKRPTRGRRAGSS